MALSLRACALRAASGVTSRVVRPLLAAAGVLALAGCGPDGQPNLTATQPRGASVAFESIDGPPPDKFRKLVENLNEEAQTRRLAVASRESPSAYRVRGYLAAKVTKHETTVSWVWDVFDGDQRRAFRITGAESVKGHHRNAWAIADDAMLHRIANSSMDQLASFLTSPEVTPGAPAPAAPALAASAPPQIVLIGDRDPSPEAAGIFRIFKPEADPVPETKDSAPAAKTASVPLPRARPTASQATGSERGTLTLAASSH
jgi:hypothetical protein